MFILNQKLRVSDATIVHTCTLSLNTGMSFIVTTSKIVVYTSQPYQTTVIVVASHRSGLCLYYKFAAGNSELPITASLIALEKVLQIMGDKRRETRSKRKGSWTNAQDIDKSLKEQKSITV